MNPKGYSYLLQPNNQIYRINKRKGDVQELVQIDRVYGYFWMLKDLRETDGKPILGNEEMVREEDAQVLPSLILETLDGHEVSIPDVVIHSNRPTLLTFSFKDFGYKLLPSWINPIQSKFQRLQIINVNITEGSSLFSFLFKKFVRYSMKQNTPIEKHKSTYTYFGNDDALQEFRDVLRMHNTYTCYVVLVDKFGRVRWTGSGKAKDEELDTLCDGVKKLMGWRD